MVVTRGRRNRDGRRSGVQIEAVRQLVQFDTMMEKSAELVLEAKLRGQDSCTPGQDVTES